MNDCYGDRSEPTTKPKRGPLQVYVGETRSLANVSKLREQRPPWGRIWTVGRPSIYIGEPWALDNGAYSFHLAGEDPRTSKRFETLFRKRIDDVLERDLPKPTMSVLPDVVGKGMHSVAFSMRWLGKLPRDLNWYLPLQDGCTAQEIEGVIRDEPRIKGLFLGGTNGFKKTAGTWRSLADQLRIRFHYGRAGTENKIRYARLCEADSLDSAWPLWTKPRFAEFVRFLSIPDPQMQLGIEMVEGRGGTIRAAEPHEKLKPGRCLDVWE